MALLAVVEQDLLASTAQNIAHQCNCRSSRAAGIARSIFRHHPEADTYAKGGEPREPGSITVHDGDGERSVINMYAQLGPGRPREPSDSFTQRLVWFRQCLAALGRTPGLRSVAFPYLIGCGMGGGNWEDYEAALRDFAASLPDVEVTLCYLPLPPTSPKSGGVHD